MATRQGGSKDGGARKAGRPRWFSGAELRRLRGILRGRDAGVDGQPQSRRERWGRVGARVRHLRQLPRAARGRSARTRRWPGVSASLLLFFGLTVGLCFADHLGRWWQAGIIVALLASGALATVLVFRAIPRDNRYRNFYVLGGLAAYVVALASCAMWVWDCLPGRVPVFSQIYHSLLLLAGESAPESCTIVPLALQAAELGGVVVLFGAVYVVVDEITSDPIARWRARQAPRVILITGLSEETLPVIRSLAEDPDGSRVVVAEANPDHPLIHQVRRYGVQVIRGELSARAKELRWLERLCKARGKHVALRRAYLLSADEQANLEAAEVIRRTLTKLGRAYRDEQRAPTRIIVRIDRYLPARHYAAQQAASWRVAAPSHAGNDGSGQATEPGQSSAQESADPQRADLLSGPRVFISTIGTAQVSVHALAEHIAGLDDGGRVLIVGKSDLSAAFRDEWRFQRQTGKLLLEKLEEAEKREQPAKPADADPSGGKAEMEKPEARPWRKVVERKARLSEPEERDTIPDDTELERLGAAVSIVLATQPTEAERARLEAFALRLQDRPGQPAPTVGPETGNPPGPAVRIFIPTDGVRGLARHPMLGCLHPFGPSLGGAAVAPDDGAPQPPNPLQGVPQDSWFRAAKLVADSYTIGSALSTWGDMPATERDSNFRATWSLLTWLSQLGYTWQPRKPEGYRPPSDELLRLLVPLEHRAWMTFKHDTGWCGAAERDDTLLLNDLLHPLSDLDDTNRAQAVERTAQTLRGLLRVLEVLGFYPVAPSRRHDCWWVLQRLGQVRVVRVVEEAEQWRDDGGNLLRAEPGDYMIVDHPSGCSQRTVKPDRFRATHRKRAGADAIYDRIGRVRARIAAVGERVDSREGPQTAGPGQWVLRDDSGAEWIVAADRLVNHYRMVGPAADVSQ